MFRGLDIAATTASGFDSRAVRAIRGQLEQIERAGRPYHERGDISNEEADELAQDAVDQRAPLCTELNAYLWRYRRWTEWKLTKSPWSLRQRVRGVSAPSPPPPPPRRLRA